MYARIYLRMIISSSKSLIGQARVTQPIKSCGSSNVSTCQTSQILHEIIGIPMRFFLNHVGKGMDSVILSAKEFIILRINFRILVKY